MAWHKQAKERRITMYRFTRIITALAIAVGIVSSVPVSAAPSQAGTAQTYIVLFKGQAVPSDAASVFTSAGGTLVYSYDQIGVAIARSDSATFSASLLNDSRIQGASSTAGFATQLNDNTTA